MSGDLPLIDVIAISVVLLAIGRGIWIGMFREGLSLAAIGLCTIMARLFVDPLSARLTDATGGDIAGKAALWIAGVLLVMATLLVCGLLARMMQSSAQLVGLGWTDRVGGAALGFAEGAIVAAVVVVIALWLIGSDHVATKGARSVEIVEHLQSAREAGEFPSVVSPGKRF
ncbi:MAG: CvpA family protein [bacterium]|nr:hypothetical protein [Deltaproteobacteria bacterium]MCP4906283.1 CvpA family protein [bacterium]